MNDIEKKQLFRKFMETKAPKVFKQFFRNTTTEDGIMLEYCFHEFAQMAVNDFCTSDGGLHKHVVSNRFLTDDDLETLKEIRDLVDDTISGEYIPDSFTNQHLNALINRIENGC